ncbi:hypothetical protein N7478_011464 [Penicillium angulare]|uniref:uncharacterized protein n=1 Tax=Penicillium angulare TaxID=116970 RepID=UPI002540E4BA|nr:uncharacterized protein N7478_011464 [Penicillium angulare]KAJ5263859.1 hypothetical protein N7478_011464 [Penicillium angulare]
MLWSLQLTWRKKGAIMAIFGLGIISIAAIFCGCAPSISVLIKAYAPSIFGPSTAKYPSNAQSPGASYVHRRNPLKSNRRRGLGDTTLGSQDAIVTANNPDQDQDGIMMKTYIQMDVATRSSGEDPTYKREYYDFGGRK